jgi:hypothetical protein
MGTTLPFKPNREPTEAGGKLTALFRQLCLPQDFTASSLGFLFDPEDGNNVLPKRRALGSARRFNSEDRTFELRISMWLSVRPGDIDR